VRLGGALGTACKQQKTEMRKEEKTMHPASLCIRWLPEQGQATHQQQYCSESGIGWYRNLRKTDLLLVIPKPGLSARNLFAADSEAADSSRDKVALRNDNFSRISYKGMDRAVGTSRPLEIVYNKACQVRPDYEPPAKTADNHFLPFGVL
jgi:hypothetical protein